MRIPQCPRCKTYEKRFSMCQTCGHEIEANVVAPLATFAPPVAAPTKGTVVLANGQRRAAEYLIGNLTGQRFLSYRTPAGHWRRTTPAEEATFTSN